MYKLNLGVSVESINPKGFFKDRFHYEVDKTLETKINQALDIGFYSVDVDICGVYNAFEVDELVPKILDIIKRTGVKVNAFHLPFNKEWIDFCTLYEPDRVEIVKWIKSLMKTLEKASPYAFVLHPGAISDGENFRDELFANLCKSADDLAHSTDVNVCIENMTHSLVLENVEQIKRFLANTKKVNMVLDVNHLLHDTQEDAILAINDRLKTLHISDYDFVQERHSLPFEGKIDWMKVLSCLEKVGYNGVFNYEVKSKYTLKQIYDNYIELFKRYNEFKYNNE